MIYSVNFMDLTEKISPLVFAKYLKDMGWEQFQSKRQYIKIFQVIIPTEKSLMIIKKPCGEISCGRKASMSCESFSVIE